MRKIQRTVLLCVISVLLVSCAPSIKYAPSASAPEHSPIFPNNTNVFVSEPEHINKEINQFILVDADVSAPTVDSLPVYEAEYFSISLDNAIDLFIVRDGAIAERNVYKDGGANITVISTVDGGSFTCYSGALSYKTERARAYENVLLFDTAFLNEYESKTETTALSFASTTQIRDEINAALSTLKIPGPLNIEVKITPLGYSVLKAQQERLTNDDEIFKYYTDIGKIKTADFTVDDDIYYATFSASLNAVPILDTPLSFVDDTTVREFMGNCIVSKKGFESFAIQGILNITAEGETRKIISSGELLDCVRHKYDDIILTSPINITKIELIYVPVPNPQFPSTVTLTPSWAVNLKTTDARRESESEFLQTLYFDATTGVELR